MHMHDMTHSSVQHDAFIHATWLMHIWDMTHLYAGHDTFTSATWRIDQCDMTHSYMRHRSCICATWLIYTRDMTHLSVWHDAFIHAIWLVHTCNMTHFSVRHGSFVSATWCIHMCNMTHSYVRHDAFMCVTWLIHPNKVGGRASREVARRKALALRRSISICETWLVRMCDTTHSYVRHDSFKCLTWLIHVRKNGGRPLPLRRSISIYETWHIHMCDMTHSYLWHVLFIWGSTVESPAFGALNFYLCVCMRVIHILVYTRKSLSLGALFPSVRSDAFVYVTWLIHNCDIIYSCEEERRKALAFRRCISICVRVCACVWYIYLYTHTTDPCV